MDDRGALEGCMVCKWFAGQ
jgi:hypothetical protein